MVGASPRRKRFIVPVAQPPNLVEEFVKTAEAGQKTLTTEVAGREERGGTLVRAGKNQPQGRGGYSRCRFDAGDAIRRASPRIWDGAKKESSPNRGTCDRKQGWTNSQHGLRRSLEDTSPKFAIAQGAGGSKRSFTFFP